MCPWVPRQVVGPSLSLDKLILSICFIKGTTPSPSTTGVHHPSGVHHLSGVHHQGTIDYGTSGDEEYYYYDEGSGASACQANEDDPEYWVMGVNWGKSTLMDHPEEVWGDSAGAGVRRGRQAMA